ncbi:MAG: hypothetical protein V2A74_10785 [bacterium]
MEIKLNGWTFDVRVTRFVPAEDGPIHPLQVDPPDEGEVEFIVTGVTPPGRPARRVGPGFRLSDRHYAELDAAVWEACRED